MRYYRIAGFRAVRDVGEDIGSLRDRLLWGAEGTLMEAKVEQFMKRWTRLMLDAVASPPEAPAQAAASAGAKSVASS